MAGVKERFAPYQRAGLASNQSGAVNVRCWLYPDLITALERRQLSSAKPTFESALRDHGIEFQTEALSVHIRAGAVPCGGAVSCVVTSRPPARAEDKAGFEWL